MGFPRQPWQCQLLWNCKLWQTHFTKYQNSLLPEREARALSAVCRRVSPSCHSLCGSSHSFLSPTWCSARRSSELAMQRSKDVKSFSASAEGETEHQHLHNDKGASVFLRKICIRFGNVAGNKMQIGKCWSEETFWMSRKYKTPILNFIKLIPVR